MIVIDSSAILAILLAESEAEMFADVIADNRCHVSLSTVFESEVVVLQRLGPHRIREVRELLEAAGAVLHPFNDDHVRLATAAYEQFGKGRHPARLNLHDCASYALARSLGAPLLYKGEDFARTDVASALTAG